MHYTQLSKSQKPNSNNQTNIKSQKNYMFNHLVLEFTNLFEIWYLIIGFSTLGDFYHHPDHITRPNFLDSIINLLQWETFRNHMGQIKFT